MTREKYDQQIQALLNDIQILGEMVETAIIDAVDALKKRDLEKSRLVRKNDIRINELRFKIENDALTTIATQAPMAKDLRVLSSIIYLAGELERIGDYAKGIARLEMNHC